MLSTLETIIIGLIIITLPQISAAEGDWQLIADQKGVALYAREISGHAETQFKGICTVNRPLEAVGSILSDIAAYPKWFFKCIEARRIPNENSSALQFFIYVAIDTPWPFSDRDAVYKTEIAIDYALGKVLISSTALKEPLVPLRSQYVRITDSENLWVLEKISADCTRITFVNRTNAGGPFANYLSNPGTRDTTVHSLENLRELK
jgi:hypothetical protein